MPTQDNAVQSRSRHGLIAFFGALCLFFAVIEYLFPKPLPFLRLGLANLPILIALRIFRAQSVLLLVLLKVLGQGLINGTLASYVFLFSLIGSFSSALVMLGIDRLCGGLMSLIGISLCGALTATISQLLLAVGLIFGQTAWVIAPLFVGLGAASGLIVGIVAQRLYDRSSWVKQIETLYGMRHA